jgi:uncharacterized membrane protein YfcA
MNVETIKACISALGVLIVAGAGALGLDIDADAVQNIVSAAVLLIAVLYGVWKNHNFTEAAQLGQILIDREKNLRKTGEE